MPTPSRPVISIIIPTKNAGKSFPGTLSAIYAQREVPPFEVIVIDSGSTDGTLGLSRRFPVKLVEIPASEFGHGKTRNTGASFASGEYLVFLVQDAVPSDSYWLRNLLAPLQNDPRIAGAYSRNLPGPEASRRQAREMARYFQPQERLQSTPADHVFSNASSMVRKAVFDSIPFPPVAFGEDTLWAEQALKAGYLIKYQPLSCVVHSHDESMSSAYLRGRQEGSLARTRGSGPLHTSHLVIVAEALYETLAWGIRGDLKSCRYSFTMAAWHFGFLNGIKPQ